MRSFIFGFILGAVACKLVIDNYEELQAKAKAFDEQVTEIAGAGTSTV